jgi:hypothetical protein
LACEPTIYSNRLAIIFCHKAAQPEDLRAVQHEARLGKQVRTMPQSVTGLVQQEIQHKLVSYFLDALFSWKEATSKRLG